MVQHGIPTSAGATPDPQPTGKRAAEARDERGLCCWRKTCRGFFTRISKASGQINMSPVGNICTGISRWWFIPAPGYLPEQKYSHNQNLRDLALPPPKHTSPEPFALEVLKWGSADASQAFTQRLLGWWPWTSPWFRARCSGNSSTAFQSALGCRRKNPRHSAGVVAKAGEQGGGVAS